MGIVNVEWCEAARAGAKPHGQVRSRTGRSGHGMPCPYIAICGDTPLTQATRKTLKDEGRPAGRPYGRAMTGARPCEKSRKMLVFKLEINGGPQKIRRAMRPAITIGCARAVKYWQQDLLPKHFRAGAELKYHYRKRTAKYLQRKRREGINLPLVYSGESRKLLTRSFAMSVRTSRKSLKATGVFTGVGNQIKYFWLTPSGNAKNQPYKPAEIHTLTRLETSQIGRLIRDCTAKIIKDTRDRKRVVK